MVCLVHEQFAEDEVTGKAYDIEQNCKNRDQHQVAIAHQKLKTAFTAEVSWSFFFSSSPPRFVMM
jgi:hypothetical protein